MSELLDQIEARHAEISKHAGLGKSQRRMLDAMFESVKDVPRLLAAVRAVEEAMDDLDDARAQGLVLTYGAIQYRVRHALADALEGER